MNAAHEVILVAGVLMLLAVFAGFASTRIGTPLQLALIGVGMLAGEDGPGRIPFDNFQVAYLIGSLALAVILFEGGLNTERDMIRRALWPAVALATVGVAISAGIVGAAAVMLFGISWPAALLLGATTAPTDAAAVSVLLRTTGLSLPARVTAALELESGLNDPMSVFLTLTLLEAVEGGDTHLAHAAGMFFREMAGGAVIGLVSGYVMLRVFRSVGLAKSAFPVVALAGALTVFGGAQLVGTSGFLATYLAGIVVGNYDHPAGKPVGRFFETLGWIAQNALFLMLGLLVTPHQLRPILGPALLITAVLVLVARPVSSMACLLPFRWNARDAGFVAWAGLRGAVPIYLSAIPLLEGVKAGGTLFNVVFVAVIVSVAIQGWTIKPAARLLGVDRTQDGRASAATGSG
jgi:potassium/hydrogen antiporter